MIKPKKVEYYAGGPPGLPHLIVLKANHWRFMLWRLTFFDPARAIFRAGVPVPPAVPAVTPAAGMG
jgi:hypothetical protein